MIAFLNSARHPRFPSQFRQDRWFRTLSLIFAAGLLLLPFFVLAPVQPALAAGTITVDRFDDIASASACTAAPGDCSLRGAVIKANSSSDTTIMLPAGLYQLTLDGGAESGWCANPAVGDLDITGNRTVILGDGPASTIIRQTTPNDRVLCVNPNVIASFNFTISNVTITGGRETFGIGGGGMFSGGPGNTTTVTNAVFSNNRASGPTSPVGGAIANWGGTLVITNTTFGGSNNPCSNQLDVSCANQSTGGGGGVYFSADNSTGSLTVGNSSFTRNVSTNGNGGGLLTTQASSYTVSNSTFTANTAAVLGGGIFNESGSLTANTNTFTANRAAVGGGAFASADGSAHNISASYNRIVDNNGSTHAVYAGSGSANSITNNWWGCNGGPGAAGCDRVSGSGTNTFNPWIILKNTASPSTINVGQDTTLTASFLQNSAGESLTAAQISRLIGLPVSWTDLVHGSLSVQQSAVQSGGTATATLTNDNTCNNSSARAVVDFIQVSDVNATGVVTVQCPDLTVVKSNNVTGATLLPAGWTWTLHVANAGSGFADFAGGVTILNDSLPTAGLIYGSPSIVNAAGLTGGTVSCSIDAFTLACTAVGSLRINAGAVFDVQFTAVPSAPGPYANPRSGGTCLVDPDSTFPESNESNACNANTVTVNTPPSMTSADHTTFTVGASGTFTVTTAAGYPLAVTLTRTGESLPSGVTFTDNHNGTATLAGTPAAGTGGVYSFTITASNGILPNPVQTFTLTVNQAPAITSANRTTFTTGASASFTVTATGFPTGGNITIGAAGPLPGGVTFTDNGDGTATLTGIPSALAGGVYPLTITAGNGIAPDATQDFTLSVNQPVAFTSADATTFKVGSAATFTLAATGYPAAAFSRTGSLPAGVTFTDNGNGTATLAGTPAAAAGGVYPLTITASNVAGPDSLQMFTLTVEEAPTITSASSVTFTAGSSGTFSVTTTGFPTGAAMAIAETGPLPGGVTFVDNHNGTATFTGTPDAAASGVYPLTLSAANGVAPAASQSLTMIVNQPPAITSLDQATFTTGLPGSFSVTATGYPTAALSETGALPGGVTFVDNGSGTASLSGTPAAGTGGIYHLTVSAANGILPDTSQSFTLTVNQPPSITSLDQDAFLVGTPGSFTVTATGFPAGAALSLTSLGPLPGGVTFTDHGDGTATLAGTPAAGTGGIYPFTLTASNGILPDAAQSFTLTINQPPAITSAASTTFFETLKASFTITTTGFPTGADMVISLGGDTLPDGLTFKDAGDGTAALGGIPAAGSGGVYHLVLTAGNGIGASAVQNFTLTVVPLLSFTSSDAVNFTVGSFASFTVAVSGTPAPGISSVGSLPAGVTFVDHHDGSATLSGTPGLGTVGGYPLTFTAMNGESPDAAQNFTLTVSKATPLPYLSLSPNPSVFGQTVTFRAEFTSTSGTPTGTVQFILDGAPFGSPVALSGGPASLPSGVLAVGSHTVSAEYSGDSNFNGVTSSPSTQVVAQASTSAVVSVDFGPAMFGDPQALKAAVSPLLPGAGVPSGTVLFYDGPTLLGIAPLDANGVAVLTPLSIPSGTHSIRVEYSGDASFASSSHTTSLLIPYRILLMMIFNY